MILGIETSSDICGVALVENARCVASSSLDRPREQSAVLLTMVDDLLKQAGVSSDRLKGLAVSLGPGSFTGLRVGLSLAKGLAFGWGKPLVGVETLLAIATRSAFHPSSLPTEVVCPVIDAKRDEVYMTAYRRQGDLLEQGMRPACGTPAQFMEWMKEDFSKRTSARYVVTGSGVERHRATFESHSAVTIAPPDRWPPLARSIARIGEWRLSRGEVPDLAGLVPLYVRELSFKKSSPPDPITSIP